MTLLYCETDETGAITWSAQGPPNFIPSINNGYFFYVDEEIKNIHEYRVVIENFQTRLEPIQTGGSA